MQGGGRLPVAEQAQRPHVREVAFAAALGYGDDMVGAQRLRRPPQSFSNWRRAR